MERATKRFGRGGGSANAKRCRPPLPAPVHDSTTFNVRFCFLVFVVLMSLLVELNGAPMESSANQTPVESFKAFIASPPNIENLVFGKVVALDLQLGLAGDATNKTRRSYFRAQWEPGSLFVRSATNLADALSSATPGKETVINLGDSYWHFDDDGMVSHWQERIRKPEDVWLPHSRIFRVRVCDLNEVMNMGIMHAPIGAIGWDGDAFSISSFIPESKEPVHLAGRVKATTNQYAQRMEVEYRTRSGIYNYTLRYDYRTNIGPAFLPSGIRSFLARDGREILLAQWEIVSIQTNSGPLLRAGFDPQSLIAIRNSPVRYYTNNNWYMLNALGRLAPVRAPYVQSNRPLENLASNNLYYGAIVLITVAAFAFAWRQNHNTKTTTTKGKLC